MDPLKLTAVQVLGLACFGVLLGNLIKKRLPLLDRLNIPAPIVGGLVYAVGLLVLRDRWLNVELDMSLSSILMVAFFTTIGMGASLELIKRGGTQVVVFFVLAVVGALLQNGLGIAMATLLGVSPLLGIVTGSVALTGGPATALAFGATFEGMGVAGATAVGVAAAMVGITAGGLLGGFLGGRLIERRGLRSRARPSEAGLSAAEAAVYAGEPPTMPAPTPLHAEGAQGEDALLGNVVAVGLAMGLGSLVSGALERTGAVLPVYVGAMIAAAVLRNLDERLRLFEIHQHQIDAIGNVALQIFIVMALMGLQLWKLADLALPLVVMLLGQVALVALLVLLVFYVMGRDYDAAVMSGGFTGFMLGTTANAMACMDVLVKKHGPAPRAFIVVPIVGAFLIDFANAVMVTGLANLVR